MLLTVSHTEKLSVYINQRMHKISSVGCKENNFVWFKPMITTTEGGATKTSLGSDCTFVSVALKGKWKSLWMTQSPFKSMVMYNLHIQRTG